MKRKYSKYILEIIKKAKEIKDWSVSDYLKPINKFYKNLSASNKNEFRASIIELLNGDRYLEDSSIRTGYLKPYDK